MFKEPTADDLRRLMERRYEAALSSASKNIRRIQAEFGKAGRFGGTAFLSAVAEELLDVHGPYVAEIMHLIVDWAGASRAKFDSARELASSFLKEKVCSFVFTIEQVTGCSQHSDNKMYFEDYREKFERQIDDALKDVEVGYIGGKSVVPKDTVQAKSIRMLAAIYDRDSGEDGLVSIDDVISDIGMSADDGHRAWRYLANKNLIEFEHGGLFARITAEGVDTIEDVKLHPDMPNPNFPAGVTYNVSINNVTGSSIPILQGVSHSQVNQWFDIDNSKRASLEKLVEVFEKRLSDLKLEDRVEDDVRTQVATIKKELADKANPRIIKEAGKTLRNITEGVIGGLIANGIEPAVWFSIYQIMTTLF